MAPLTRSRAGSERIPNDLMAEYYRQRASCGLIISEATTVSQQANGWVDSPGIYTDEMRDGWKKVTEAVHSRGGKIFCQLWHMGRAAHSSFNNRETPVSASSIRMNVELLRRADNKKVAPETPRALSTEEIPHLIETYRRAALRAKEANFDGIEIHSANGYLLDQFLQSKTNHRTDAYGGSLPNRCRLLLEIFDATAAAWGDPGRVGVRLSPNGGINDMGSEDYRETFLYAASQLSPLQPAYLHVMDGLKFGFHELGEAMTLKDFRGVFEGPLMGNCGYEQESAEEMIASGDADLISFGRPLISNPDLVERFEVGAPLNPPADVTVYYALIGEKGYTDFPTLTEEEKGQIKNNAGTTL
uniref:NADH:flavin oxidoreductase/NADH oxidase N-terminal domain-containing protein n=1 Tax=Chromera velia CCMP2878 TaxID=1169474 RepID=A0A0G4HPK3_9ALVE|eukprot:Cvel_1240.t1-p1 / transcript=Cvel_1240.t1 / gene=Cvel_1240 / organism=Chromera_velia_CCMP2878 / gene_product=N-ethylmaleimide reductase, putative / transcript_product=N-ethylmaleimide reductase, putative / location=Cvel_scaffold41:104891-107598(+) / protein_length=357 / sequence_SO=supercontig / SO=protein_coding / is_pseudo=false